MNILENKWIRVLLVLGMVAWIFSSNPETKKIVEYAKDTEVVKKDIDYTISKTREALIVSKMTEEELKEYYLKKQKEQIEADLIKAKTENDLAESKKKLNPKIEQNLSGFAKLQETMKGIREKELAKEKIEVESEAFSDNTAFQPTEEEKLFAEEFVIEKYGKLTNVTERVIKCGDYVSYDFMLYDGKKQIIPKPMKMNVLIGSDTLPEMEQMLEGMFHGQKKKFNLSKKQSKSSGSKKISQEIKILSIKEIEKKELLECK